MEGAQTEWVTVAVGFGHLQGEPHLFGWSAPGVPSTGALDLAFVPAGRAPWLGRFAGGLTHYSCVQLIDPWLCCVVASGQGYLIDVREPERTVILPGSGIVNSVFAERGEVCILVSPTDLAGIVSDGHWWQSERLASDGIRDVAVLRGIITGMGWQAHSDTWVGFAIDSVTGRDVHPT